MSWSSCHPFLSTTSATRFESCTEVLSKTIEFLVSYDLSSEFLMPCIYAKVSALFRAYIGTEKVQDSGL